MSKTERSGSNSIIMLSDQGNSKKKLKELGEGAAGFPSELCRNSCLIKAIFAHININISWLQQILCPTTICVTATYKPFKWPNTFILKESIFKPRENIF